MRSISIASLLLSALLLAACSQPAPHRGEVYMLRPGAVEIYPATPAEEAMVPLPDDLPLPPDRVYRLPPPHREY